MRVYNESFWQNNFTLQVKGENESGDPAIMHYYEDWQLWFEYDGEFLDDEWNRDLAVLR